jgi:hypothetical protein
VKAADFPTSAQKKAAKSARSLSDGPRWGKVEQDPIARKAPMIRFWCECGRQLQARAEDIGRLAACPLCGKTATVPDRDQPRSQEAPCNEQIQSRSAPLPLDPDEIGRENRRPFGGVAQATSGLATGSLVCGVLSFPLFLGLLTGIPAIILAILALRKIGQSKGQLGGKGSAIAGLVLGCIGLVTVPVMLFAVERVRDASARVQDSTNLKEIGIAFHNHNDTYGYCPAATAYRTKDGKPGLSWRVAILPFIEQDNLYKQFHFDEPWDSPHNLKLLPLMPKTYLMPGEKQEAGLTHYQVFVGPAGSGLTPFAPKEQREQQQRWHMGFVGIPAPEPGPRIPANFQNGTSNTILIATARDPVPWTKPDDLPYDPNKPLPPLGGRFRGGFNVCFADGAPRWIDNRTPETTLRSAIDGQPKWGGTDW